MYGQVTPELVWRTETVTQQQPSEPLSGVGLVAVLVVLAVFCVGLVSIWLRLSRFLRALKEAQSARMSARARADADARAGAVANVDLGGIHFSGAMPSSELRDGGPRWVGAHDARGTGDDDDGAEWLHYLATGGNDDDLGALDYDDDRGDDDHDDRGPFPSPTGGRGARRDGDADRGAPAVVRRGLDARGPGDVA